MQNFIIFVQIKILHYKLGDAKYHIDSKSSDNWHASHGW